MSLFDLWTQKQFSIPRLATEQKKSD